MAEEKDIKIIENKVCLSTKELRCIFKLSSSTMASWRDRGCPCIMRGWYSIADVLEWRGMVSATGTKTEEELANMTLQEQKLALEVKLKQAQSEAIELKNDIAKGNYIPREDIVKELQRFFTVFKRSLINLSGKISNEIGSYLEPQDARLLQDKIQADILEGLEQLHIDGIYSRRKAKSKMV